MERHLFKGFTDIGSNDPGLNDIGSNVPGLNDIGSNDKPVKNAKKDKTTKGQNGKKYFINYFRVRLG